MKKTFTFLIVAAVAAVFGCFNANATDYYKNYFINESFNELEALPSGWSVITTTSSHVGRNGSITLTDQWLAFGGSGSGSRGGQLSFPSTSNFTYLADSIWNVEFDWVMTSANSNWTRRNAYAIIFAGSGGTVTNAAEDWYYPAVFGFYVYKDGGKIHYMNKDRDGLPKKDAATCELLPDETNGHVILGGNWQSWARGGSSDAIADSLNLPSATEVTAAYGATYHITVAVDFKVASQKVLSVVITDLADPTNTDSIGEFPFLAPTYAGTAATTEVADRIVTDLACFNMINTRSTGGTPTCDNPAPGNGNNANLTGGGVDNLDIYVWKESLGRRTVTINYKDQDGAQVKASREVLACEVGNPYALINSDKLDVVDGGFYYAYNADATHAANAAKSESGESLIVDLEATYNTLDVIFKKSTLTEGTYVWSGADNGQWDKLHNNFKVGAGSDISYQAGNPVAFSDATVINKEVEVATAIELGNGDFTISAPDYSFTGAGRLTGTGALKVNAAATLGADNRLEGGAIIGTSDPVVIQLAAAATKITADASPIALKFDASFSKAIDNPATGGTLNVYLGDVALTSAITGFSTINLNVVEKGRETGNAWTNPFSSVLETGTQINVIDALADSISAAYPATYAIDAGTLANAKVHLGDNTRIILNSTPGANATSTVNIGELSGTAGATLQGNCVSADFTRLVNYSVGALNTDATFNGNIIPQLTREPGRRSGTEEVWERLTVEGDTVWYIPSTQKITKVGTGTWTLGGKIIMPSETAPSTVTVSAGTLEMLDSLVAPEANVIAVTVERGGTLKLHGNYIGAATVSVNGTLEGGAVLGGSINMTDSASLLKLKVNSFNAGDFEVIKASSDIAIKKGEINITVVTPPTDNDEILILDAGANYDIAFANDTMPAQIKIVVNGEDITLNEAGMEVPPGIAGIYYLTEVGTLGYIPGSSALDDKYAGKEIQKTEYFNALGQQVKESNLGYTLQKITYTDGTVRTRKALKREK